MTTTNTTAAEVVASAKARPVFYTRKNAHVAIALWLSVVTTPRAPMFIGTVNGEQVSGFVRNGEKGTFIDLVGPMVDGVSKPVAKGNVIVNNYGIPKLAVRLDGANDPVFAEVSLDMPQDKLVQAGLRLDLQEAKRTAHAAAKAAKAESKEEVAA